jgi:two-component system, chemotaxis family, chemotaxis protein CheY
MAVNALIVDDSTFAREVIAYHLRETRCAIVGEAINAAEGLKLFRKHNPEIVTVDLLMPISENVDAATLVKAMKQERPRVAIIVVSTIPFEKTMQDFLDQGVMAYIVKPFTEYSFRNTQLKLSREFPELANPR